MHPFALPHPHYKSGGTNRNGQQMQSGDRIRCMITGRTGIADEFLSDGDTFISWDDGSFGTAKWYNLEPV